MLQNPFDAVPPQAWLTLGLAFGAAGSAIYCWQYLAHGLTPRDITLPPEDLSWKSRSQFYRSLALLTALAGIGVFIWTPQAEAFAKSDWFFPTLFGIFGSYALGTVIPGWKNGSVQPLVQGVQRTFLLAEQPKRYWASLLWNAVLGGGFLAASLFMGRDNLTPECADPDTGDRAELSAALAECDALAADKGLGPDVLADLHAARGRIHHRLGSLEHALQDYSRAIAVNPRDSYALHARGSVLMSQGELDRAIADLDASLALRPDNRGGYYDRAWAHALAGRRQLAEKDFLRSGEDAPPWPDILVQRAEMAIEKRDHAGAVALASEALETHPNHMLALQLRSEAYFKLGELERSIADDDRVRILSAERHSQRPST